MEKNHDLNRHAGAVTLTLAVIIVALAVVPTGGHPEAMSLGVLAALFIVSPFAMLSPTLPRSPTRMHTASMNGCRRKPCRL